MSIIGLVEMMYDVIEPLVQLERPFLRKYLLQREDGRGKEKTFSL